MDRDTIRQKLKDIMDRCVGEAIGTIEETTNLKEELKFDSIDFVSMALEVQSDFDVELKSEEFPDVVLVKDLIDLIQKKLPTSGNLAA